MHPYLWYHSTMVTREQFITALKARHEASESAENDRMRFVYASYALFDQVKQWLHNVPGLQIRESTPMTGWTTLSVEAPRLGQIDFLVLPEQSAVQLRRPHGNIVLTIKGKSWIDEQSREPFTEEYLFRILHNALNLKGTL